MSNNFPAIDGTGVAAHINAQIGSTYTCPDCGTIIGDTQRTARWSPLDELKRMISTLDLPRSVHEETARLYEKAVDNDIVKGQQDYRQGTDPRTGSEHL